ncbi:21909_t:CDS:1, partial [Cetraspora pellucida]
MIREVQSTQLKVMLFAFNSSECNTAKSLHYFKTPTQLTIVCYYCQKFHILFTSSNLNIPFRQATPPSSSQKSIYIDINITSKQIKQLKKIIPQSPITKTTTISSLPFSLNYSTTQQETLSSSKQTPQIQAYSYHTHICIICQNKNILCAFLENNTYSFLDKSILIIKEFLAHPE